MEKKKLLIPTDSFLPRWDGIARFLKELLPILAKKYDILVIAPDFGELKEQIDGVKIIRLPTYDFSVANYRLTKVNRKNLKTIKQLVKQADIVWGQTIGTIGAASMYYANKYKKSLLAYIHSIEWDLFSKSQKRFQKTVELISKLSIIKLYNWCDLLLVPSEETSEMLDKQRIKTRKMLVHLGTNIREMKTPEDKAKAKKKIGLNPEKIVIGYLGRMGREKNLKTLYHAFRALRTTMKNITLLVVGGQIDKLDFINMDAVKNIDTVENVIDYYQAMDIYVLPSLTETTSLTTMEAMACGVPVVCTPVGFVKEYVQHRQNGYLFPKGNISRLKLTLKNLISKPHLRERIGKRGRQTIIKNYSWDKTAKQISEVLSEF